MKSIYVIDAVNLIFRSYYAIGPMTNLQGESTNALFGFIRSVYKIISSFKPDLVVAVFDGPDNKKMRTEIYADYKSHRKAMPEDLYAQIEKALFWCGLSGIPSLSIPGVEADDTMGAIALLGEKKGLNTFLCSSDKDLAQLVNDHTFLLHFHKENAILDAQKVKELYGVNPDQIVDYLALMGDASDNIPGVEGFGPKTASSLLQEFGSLENLFARLDELPKGKKKEALIQGKESAFLSQKLARIYTAVAIPQEELFYQLKEPDLEKIRHFYEEMRFLSLLKELPSAINPSPVIPSTSTLIETEEALITLLKELSGAKEICLDTETTSVRPLEASLVGIGLGANPHKAFYIPLNGTLSKKFILYHLTAFLKTPHLLFFGHNIKYDLHILENENLPLPKVGFDTMIASYVLKPHTPQHNLDALTLEHFQKTKIPIESLIGKGKTTRSMLEAPIDKVSDYCCEDVIYTTRLKELFLKELKERNLFPLFEEIEIPLIPVLQHMERRGIYIDVLSLKKMSEEFKEKAEGLEKEIFHEAGEVFNIHSPKQLSHILFDKLQIKPLKKTQTGFSTRADVLEELQDKSPLIKHVIAYRFVEKLRSTYTDSLQELIHPKTKRIHCSFNQSVAATGRLSSQDPNLQNIPLRSLEGKKIRAAFKPQEALWSFLSADYSQIELRLLAHFSEDPALLKAFHEGLDVHAYTASLVFDVPLTEVTDEMRQKAKAVNFGVLYGQQAFGLSQGLKIDYKEAASFIETYFKRYGKVKEYLESCKESARKLGYALTLSRRQRPIPEIDSKNPQIRAAAERLAINTPLQGANADLIKMAMIRIDAYLQKNRHLGYMLVQIHDELLFEAPDLHIKELSTYVKQTMEEIIKLKVPLKVDISIGKNWGEC